MRYIGREYLIRYLVLIDFIYLHIESASICRITFEGGMCSGNWVVGIRWTFACMRTLHIVLLVGGLSLVEL